jgi:DNA-binding NarL/FixJ family response regulator
MYRIYLACDDLLFCEALRNTFQTHADFTVFGEAKNDIEVLKEVMKLAPSLVVMEANHLLGTVSKSSKP